MIRLLLLLMFVSIALILISNKSILFAQTNIPPQLTSEYPMIKNGVHLVYNMEVVKKRIPESVVQKKLKAIESTQVNSNDEYIKQQQIDYYRKLGTSDQLQSDTVEYYGTSTGALWIEADTRFAIAYNGKSETTADPSQLIAGFPPIPKNAKSQEAFVVRPSLGTMRNAVPHLGFYQPCKDIYKSNLIIVENTDDGKIIRYKDNDSKWSYRYTVILNKKGHIVQIKEYIGDLVSDEWSLDDYRLLEEGFAYPGIVRHVNYKFEFTGGDKYNHNNYLSYVSKERKFVVQSAELRKIDSKLFDANNPPTGTVIQDDRYGVQYVYTDKSKTVEESSLAEQTRQYHTRNPLRISLLIQIVCISLILVIAGLLIRKVAKIRGRQISS